MGLTDGIQAVDELDLEHKRVLIRVDWNVPINEADGSVGSEADAQLREALPTLSLALEKGAKVIVASHLGAARPGRSGWPGLEPVGARICELAGCDILLPDDCVGDAPRKLLSELRAGQVILLENLRAHGGELKRDEAFARKLADLCDVYVNEAFSLLAGPSASIEVLPRLVRERAAGLALARDLRTLDGLCAAAKRPFVVVLGGTAWAENQGLLDALLARADVIAFGGVLANTLLVASGVPMRSSPFEADKLPSARTFLGKARDAKVQVLLPTDVLASDAAERASGAAIDVRSLSEGEMALDLGPRTVERYAGEVARAGTVLLFGSMNAPLAKGFTAGTLAMIDAVSKSAGLAVAVGEDLAHLAHLAHLAPVEEGARPLPVFRSESIVRAVLEGRKLAGIEAIRGSGT